MKKILLSILLLSPLTAMAQTNDHMSFKGVAMEGRVLDFARKLTTRGYTAVSSGTSSYLTGDFAGYRNCTIELVGTDVDYVNTVTVFFPQQFSWTELEDNYMNIKKVLVDKYKTPSLVEESFNTTYSEPTTDRSKFYEVQLGHCQYRTVFKGRKGEIVLEIRHRDQSCFVALSYIDYTNQALYHKKVMGDL